MSAIELYEKLFYIFTGMSVLSLGLSIFLFIRFDIPQTYAMLTGKARRKTIQEIENRNAQTGKLRQHPKGYATGNTGQTSRRRRSGDHTGKTGQTAQDISQRETKRPKPASRPAPRPTPQERPETEVLSVNTPETVILSKPTGITEDLGQTAVLQPVQNVQFYFQITENTISVHTDEII